MLEFRRWQNSKEAEWTTVGKKKQSSSPMFPLTGANAIPMNNSNFGRRPNHGLLSQLPRQSVFTRLNSAVASHPHASIDQFAGFLGKRPSQHTNGPLQPSSPFCSRCLARDHLRPNCTNRFRCLACNRYGHSLGNCWFLPTRPTERQGHRNLAYPDDRRLARPMTSGPKATTIPLRFASSADYFTQSIGIVPPP